MKKRIVIIGGCAAGPKCAAKSRRMNADTEILLYTSSSYVSYSACGLPYFIGGAVKNINELVVRTPEEFAQSNIKVFTEHTCTEIDPKHKEVTVEGEKISYDELVIATGASPRKPDIKGIDLENIKFLRFLKDGVDIKRLAVEARSVLIVGFGYIAIEMIEAFLKNGLKVFVVENHNHIMSFFDPEISDKIEEHIKSKDGDLVEIIKNDSVIEFFGKEKFEGAKTSKGRVIKADFCLVATGVRPNTELASKCGIQIGTTGAIKVDNKMRTNIEHIWAVGDCAEKTCMITRLPTYQALGSIANKEGRVCAINMNGGMEFFDGVLGSAVCKYFDFTMGISGMTEMKALEAEKRANIEVISTTVTKCDKPDYMPGAHPITIKLIADKRSGELLGVQGIGTGDVDKRVNTVASALQSRMTVNEFLHLDLTYAPPVSGTIDPLLTACYNLKSIIEK